MSLTDYLAKNYLNAEPSKPAKGKKRKRRAEEANGLSVADDDITGWEPKPRDDKDGRRRTVADAPAKSRWKTVGGAPPTNAEQKAADDIIAATEAENKARGEGDDEAPQIVDMDDEDDTPRMASGVRAGLQSGAQVTATLQRKQDLERKRLQDGLKNADSKMGETIYRDATGRIVNAKLIKADAAREKEDKERREQEGKAFIKGDVQRREAEERKAKLEDAKHTGVARYADDQELNDEMKARDRWNDPAAGFITKKEPAKSKSGKRLYKGGFEPNRYGIRPGHRWDGVDRSGGFERKWFEARNNQKNRRDLEYAWQMDE